MIWRLAVILVLYGPITGGTLVAAEAALDLPQLIQKALAANAELKGMQAELAASRARVGPAASLEDPMLGVELMNVPTDSFRMNQSEMSGMQISLSQKFPFPGKRDAQKNLAKRRSEVLEHRLKQLQLTIAWNVKRIYYELHLKSTRKNILEKQRAFLRQTLSTSRNRYALNQLAQAAVLNIQVEEAQLLDQQLRLSSEIKNLEAELAHVSGHAEHSPSIETKPLHRARLDLSAWTDADISKMVVDHNEELQALQSEVEASEGALALARTSYYPDFELMASYLVRDKVPGMDPGRSGQDMVGAKIAVSLPLWGSTKQSEEIKEAAAGRERSSFALENARLMQIHEARALFAELKESLQRIDLYEGGLLQLSRQAVATGNAAYLAGKEDYKDLLEALRRQQDAEYGYQEALVAYQLQLAKLEALIGQNLGNKAND